MKIRNNIEESTFQLCDITNDGTSTVAEVMLKIHAQLGVPCKYQKLRYHGQSLKKKRTLSYYGIADDDVLDLSYGMSGGCFHWRGWTCCCIPF